MLRKEADKLLLAEENPRGTFLVRPSEHNPNGYSLSVKDWEDGRGYHVKHYRIKPLDNGGFYIATNQTFASLQALVMAYSSEYWTSFRDGQLSSNRKLYCRKRARPVSHTVASLPQTAATDVGSWPGAARQI